MQLFNFLLLRLSSIKNIWLKVSLIFAKSTELSIDILREFKMNQSHVQDYK